jgi:hypothetical protein
MVTQKYSLVFLILAAAVVAFSLHNCGKENNPADTDNGGQQTDSTADNTSTAPFESDSLVMTELSYRDTEDDSIEIITPAQTACDSNDELTTVAPDTQKVMYLLDSEKGELQLVVMLNSNFFPMLFQTYNKNEEFDTIITAMSKLPIAISLIFTSVSSSADNLEGDWAFSTIDLGALAFLIPKDSKASLDSIMGGDEIEGLFVLNIDNGTIAITMSKEKIGKTVVFSAVDTAVYDIDVEMKEPYQWELTGNKSEEVVTITIHDNGDITYRSSVSEDREPYSFYIDPTECPNEMSPSWFDLFLEDNVR